MSGATRLSAEIVTLAAAGFALIPLFVNPYRAVYYTYEAFTSPKFELLLGLSGLLLVAVVAATLLGARFMRVPMLLPIAVFLIVSALSTAFSEDAYRSLVGSEARRTGLLSLAAGVLLFYAVARFLDSRTKARYFLAAGVISAVLIATYGILQRFRFDPLFDLIVKWSLYEWAPYAGTRVFSTIGNPIFLAAYLTLMMGTTAALYFEASARWERVLWLSALVPIGACWFYTYTRGAILGVGIAVPVVLWLSHRRMGTASPLLIPMVTLAAAVLAAVVLGGAIAVSGSAAAKRLADTQDQNTVARILIWRDTVPVILERPLLGHGPDNFQSPFARHEGEDLKTLTAFQPVDKAHNEFLDVAATTGVLGLAAYVWIFATYFRNAYQHGGWTLIALSGGVLAYILQLQTIFTTLPTSITFWALLGVSSALLRLPHR